MDIIGEEVWVGVRGIFQVNSYLLPSLEATPHLALSLFDFNIFNLNSLAVSAVHVDGLVMLHSQDTFGFVIPTLNNE